MEFTNAEGVTYVYEPLAITIQQAVVAEEIVTYINQVRARTDSTLDKIAKTGSYEWLGKCVSALLVLKTDSGNQPWSFLAWDTAEHFVKLLPVSEYVRLQECLEHFFLSMKKSAMLSAALGKDTSQAQGLGQLLSLMKRASANVSEATS